MIEQPAKRTSRFGFWVTSGKQRLAGLALILALACGQASAVNLGIENDAEYATLASAMRAAEYVRSEVIEADAPKPRVYAVLAGVMAFAERNPNVSDVQLAAFVQAFDAAIQTYTPGDPNLVDRATFSAALRFTTVDDAIFNGTDTSIGKRALELLGVTIPDPDGFESIQRRMVRYEFALLRPLGYRNEILDLLVSGFYGQDPAGGEHVTLPSLLNTYFAAQGFDPALGSERTDNPSVVAVNAGLAILPVDFAAYTAAIAQGAENTALQAAVAAQLATVRLQIDSIVGTDSTVDDGSLDTAIATGPGLAQSVDLALNDPAYLQQVLDERRADLQATAQARAATSSATYLMLQSSFADIGAYASYTRDYSQIALETNQEAANIKTAVLLGGSVAAIAAGAQFGDPSAVIGGLLSVGNIGLNMVSDAPPSVEEQTFNQIAELRQQVEELRLEMNQRFDRIDQQLNIMYQTLTMGFDALGQQVGDLTTDVDSLIREMAAARSSLRRLEAALYGVAQDILLSALTNETNVVLDFRDENSTDLRYSGGNPDFITASESFFTYATVTSLAEAFVGSRTSDLTLDNANELIGNASLSVRLNDLAVLPQLLGQNALVVSDLPGIEPWSQAASAYAQLARENPWYFGFRYRGQLDDFNSDPQNESLPELDRIIRSGEQIVSLVTAIRQIDGNGDSALFDALIQNYKDAATEFQAQVNAEIVAGLPAEFTNGATTLDYWANAPQYSVEDLIASPDLFFFEGEGSFDNLDAVRDGLPNSHKGFSTWAKCGCLSPVDAIPLMQTWYLLRRDDLGDAVRPRYRHELGGGFSGDGRYTAKFYLGTDGEASPRIRRTIRYKLEKQDTQFEGFPSPWAEITTDDLDDVSSSFNQNWPNLDDSLTRYDYSGFDPSVLDSLTGDVHVRYGSNPLPTTDYRMTITGDSGQAFPVITASEIQPGLYSKRLEVSNDLVNKLANPVSSLSAAAVALDNAEALLDAYVTIGMAKELNQSEVLRSALRARPGTSELGLGSADMTTLINQIDIADSPSGWADQSMNVTQIQALLNGRIELIAAEIKRGLQQPAFAPDYVGFVLAELRHLRDSAFDLAVDDTYSGGASSSIIVEAAQGLLANDINQEFRVITVDTAFEFEPEYVAPANGAVTVNDDGSFTYTPAAGFVGTDSFNYRSKTTVADGSAPALSNPAMVVVNSGAVSPEVVFANGFEQ